jgi:hypothetical protein
MRSESHGCGLGELTFVGILETDFGASHKGNCFRGVYTAGENPSMKTPTIVAGRYALQEPARPGGMADVYPAVDITNGKKVAVKLFRQGLSQNEIAKEV